ncbi:hypothetical protein [Antarctobacter sp.]|uniref:hypothetical protein n=1 Tax=Antarctobacter sp. TaxID=1872577 RepID=UPI002B26E80F|nr:hypothetical protein [Antarctobacter sp.]
MSELSFSLAAAGLVLCAPMLPLAAKEPPAVGSVALVIASPLGMDAAQIAAHADVPKVGPVRAGLGVFVEITNATSIDRLRASGALFVVPGDALLALCAS